MFIVPSAQEGYAEPFGILSTPGSVPEIHVQFEDYTGDRIPEIVFDAGTWGGGTGESVYEEQRSIIHCEGPQCETVWNGTRSREVQDYNSGGRLLEHTSTSPDADSSGLPLLRVLHEGFSIYCCGLLGTGSQPTDTLDVFPSTLSIFAWQDGTFSLKGEEVAALGRTTNSLGPLLAENADGLIAGISWEDNKYIGNANEYCRVYISSSWIGEYFGCRHKFTRVSWEDMTGDGRDDFVVTTYSAGYPIGPVDLLSYDSCMHQRVLVFGRQGSGYSQIANIAGCVIRDDLFGIQIKDEDGDGIPEIIATPLIVEMEELPTREYKWNGQQFVLWGSRPDLEVERIHLFPQ